ncbi:MAG: leucine-rich repeat domain-containing protein [Candidatus Hermodarchaeota archaeon]
MKYVLSEQGTNKVRHLDLGFNPISDITPLYSLKKLNHLVIIGCNRLKEFNI